MAASPAAARLQRWWLRAVNWTFALLQRRRFVLPGAYQLRDPIPQRKHFRIELGLAVRKVTDQSLIDFSGEFNPPDVLRRIGQSEAVVDIVTRADDNCQLCIEFFLQLVQLIHVLLCQ